MTTMIMDGDGELVQEEFDFYLKGNPSLENVTLTLGYSFSSFPFPYPLPFLSLPFLLPTNCVTQTSSRESAETARVDIQYMLERSDYCEAFH